MSRSALGFIPPMGEMDIQKRSAKGFSRKTASKRMIFVGGAPRVERSLGGTLASISAGTAAAAKLKKSLRLPSLIGLQICIEADDLRRRRAAGRAVAWRDIGQHLCRYGGGCQAQEISAASLSHRTSDLHRSG